MAGRRLVWTGYAAAGCAVLWLPLHLYYGLGGTAGRSTAAPSIEALPDWLTPAGAALTWRLVHLAIAATLAAVAVLAIALVRPWGRALPSGALIVPAFAVTVAALAYAVGTAVSGVTASVGRAVPEAVRAAADVVGVLDGNGLTGFLWDVGTAGPRLVGLDAVDLSGGPSVSAYQMVSLVPWALALGLTLALAVTARLGPVARRIWLVAVVLGVLRLVL